MEPLELLQRHIPFPILATVISVLTVQLSIPAKLGTVFQTLQPI